MNRVSLAEHGPHRTRKRRSSQVLTFLGALAVGGLGVVALYNPSKEDTKRLPVSTVIPCELTGEATPLSGGAGFALKARCPEGIAHVAPSLSLWLRMIEALPPENRIVDLNCTVRPNGNYTDCKKTNNFAYRNETSRTR